MKCLYFGCENETYGNYLYCSFNHKTATDSNVKALSFIFDADDNRTVNPEYNPRGLMTIEQAEYYSKIELSK